MTSSVPTYPRKELPGVIAVVGCDGAGKSTLTTDLVKDLSRDGPCELLYLGQDSGNILRWIKRLPVIGEPVGRYLNRKSSKVHTTEKVSPLTGLLTAVVIYLLSRWRFHKFQRLLKLSDRNILVVTDRYPQVERQSFYFDGPGLKTDASAGPLIRWLTERELRLYRRMAAYVPKLVIRLDISAEQAYARKPDHKLSMLQAKAGVLPTLTFNRASMLDLDATAPYPQVRDAALKAIRSVAGRIAASA